MRPRASPVSSSSSVSPLSLVGVQCPPSKLARSSHAKLLQPGAPGAGKGTLAHMLASQCHFRHVSVGDLLRRVAANPATSDVVRGYVERGELLPSELLFPILRARFDRYLHNTGFNKCIILDGFPRMLSQAVEFEREVSSRLLPPVPGEPVNQRSTRASDPESDSGHADPSPVWKAQRRHLLRLSSGPGKAESAQQTGGPRRRHKRGV